MFVEYPNGTYGVMMTGYSYAAAKYGKNPPPEFVYYVVVQDKEDGYYMIVESTIKDDYLPISAHSTMEWAERAWLKLSNK